MVQVGKTKDQGLNNKPSAAVHPGALAAGTLTQYNTIPSHLRLGISSDRFTSDLPTKTLYTPVPSLIRATCPALFILLG